MKLILLAISAFLLTMNSMASAATAASQVRQGEFVSGYNATLRMPIKTKISVSIQSSDRGAILIAGLAKINAVVEGETLGGYVSNPVEFHYIKVDLNPTLRDGRVLKEDRGASWVTCADGANALVKTYRGDGQVNELCAKFE